MERKWHLHLATPRRLLLDRRAKASLFFAAPPPPKRAPSTTLTLRSKSMTAELEELGEHFGWTVGEWPKWGWMQVVWEGSATELGLRQKEEKMGLETDQQLGVGLERWGKRVPWVRSVRAREEMRTQGSVRSWS